MKLILNSLKILKYDLIKFMNFGTSWIDIFIYKKCLKKNIIGSFKNANYSRKDEVYDCDMFLYKIIFFLKLV